MRMHNVHAPHAFTPTGDETAFRFRNGDVARSLEEFAHVLPKLPVDDVDYHRGHFHHWVADIVGDRPLAERFRQYGESTMPAPELAGVLTTLTMKRLDELRATDGKPKKATGGARKPERKATKKSGGRRV